MSKREPNTGRTSRFTWLPLCVLVIAAPAAAAQELASLDSKIPIPTPSNAPVAAPAFESTVRPIFKTHCFQCHGEAGAKQGKLDLRLARTAISGGASGPAVTPGNPEESYLLDRIRSGEMPPGKKPLSARESAAIEAWIAAGAKTARPEPANPEALQYTPEELAHWAYQPVRKPPVPKPPREFVVRQPIDAFVAATLAAHKITSFSPEADRRTLVRRMSFDLIGLPPTPEEVAAFEADTAPNAVEKVIDRLLASPHYGERWGRHWLDVAGYSESDIRYNKDQPRDWAWKYRDYVIAAHNSDMPWDRFIVEQLAADELLDAPPASLPPERAADLAAVAFLRMAPDNTLAENSLLERNRAVAETIKVATSALLGATVGCAECHDHRYDPISTVDYYRLRAIFDPAFDIHHWKLPGERVVRVTPLATRKRIEAIEEQAAALDKKIRDDETAIAAKILEREIAKAPPEKREPLRKAVALADGKRSADQEKLLKEFLTVRPIPHIIGLLVEYDRKAAADMKSRREAVAKLRATKPLEEYVGIPAEPTPHQSQSRVFFRGDFDQPKQAVTPAEPFAFAMHRPSPDLPIKDPKTLTSGRRLAWAKRLTDGKHPLVARVLVNRFWMHHFGRGLVATPGDFGKLGERPSHPELLDWLADDFVANGWKLKRLHKLILLSTTYRQSSRRTPLLEKIDSDNRLLGRMSVRRLEAEAVRDALLAVGGDLTTKLYGPSVPVVESGEGKAVIGKRKLAKDGLFYGEVEPSGPDSNRRSVYVQALRMTPCDMLDAFDAPGMAPNCELRKYTTVPTQSLLFLNDSFILERAERLAARVAIAPTTLPADRARAEVAAIEKLHWLLFGRTATASDRAACLQFIHAQADYFSNHKEPPTKANSKESKPPADPRRLAWAALCQTLLCANEFLYVD